MAALESGNSVRVGAVAVVVDREAFAWGNQLSGFVNGIGEAGATEPLTVAGCRLLRGAVRAPDWPLTCVAAGRGLPCTALRRECPGAAADTRPRRRF